MNIEGDIVTGKGRVEPNHCGFPWPVSLEGEYCGVIQITGHKEDGSSIFCDALSGEYLTRKELDDRLNNYKYDYENKSKDCLNWKEKNRKRIIDNKVFYVKPVTAKEKIEDLFKKFRRLFKEVLS